MSQRGSGSGGRGEGGKYGAEAEEELTPRLVEGERKQLASGCVSSWRQVDVGSN